MSRRKVKKQEVDDCMVSDPISVLIDGDQVDDEILAELRADASITVTACGDAWLVRKVEQ